MNLKFRFFAQPIIFVGLLLTLNWSCKKEDPPINAWVCGDDLTFTYRDQNVTYGTVEGQNGTCWLDRNLGASRVATAYNDSEAYGDLFQWGRSDDGHQLRTSHITSTLSSNDNPGHGNFITASASPWDWRSPQNNDLWQGEGSFNVVCPPGWRLPTEAELNAECESWGSKDAAGAFASPLKLPVAGMRFRSDGSLNYLDFLGFYWSSTVGSTRSRRLLISSDYADMGSYDRAYGLSMRCIKD